MNLRQETIDKITSALCVQVLQGIGQRLLVAIEKWNNEEGKQFLFTITDDHMVSEDLRIRSDFYNAARPALDFIEDSDLQLAFEKELRYMILDRKTKAAEFLYDGLRWLSFWEHTCYTEMRNTGIWELEITNEQKNASSFYLLMKFKAEQPDKHKLYIEKEKQIRAALDKVRIKTMEKGSIDTYNTYIQPLIDKGL